MDITQRIDALTQVLESAKTRALGGGAVVDREKALQIIDDIKASLPVEIQGASEVVASADAIRSSAQTQADSIISEAKARSQVLASEHEIAQAAENRAAQILLEAEAEADNKRAEVDAYVDSKLASFEGVLTSTLESVHHGRQKLASARLPELAENPA